jgi:cell wall-associated NlpC family hydrolase
MDSIHAICRVAIATLRAEQSDRSEVVSQLLFGDKVQILEKAERWYWVRNAYDNYEGWADFRQFSPISEEEFLDMPEVDYLIPPAVQNPVKAEDGSTYYLAASGSLPKYKDGSCYLGQNRFEVNFEPIQVDYSKPINNIEKDALFYLNSPYQWGCRTMFGIDCSGFVQAVFKMSGIKLNRDASQQALQGETVDFLPAVQTGDVAFFDNEEGKITHVGILLNSKEIIHSSAKVKIDPIDDQGIFNRELNKYSHKLRIIKRFLK